tara:strand:- start:326 stop:502 length:177 start_codon:yes stop_codon:yes gene_type:complete
MTEYEKSQLRKLVQDKIQELEQFANDWYNDNDEDYSPTMRLNSKIKEYQTILEKINDL